MTTLGDEAAHDDIPKSSVERRSSAEFTDANNKKATTRILGYCCPKCGQRELASLHEAVQHCRKPEEQPVFVMPDGNDEECLIAVTTTVHDGRDRAADPGEPFPSASAPSSWAPTIEAQAPLLPALPGEPIAFDSYGRPVIARQVDPDTGGKTMVLNDDGSCDVFGKQTIASLLSSTETETDDWIQVLTDFQLRGLVHEIGQRLLESSQLYQARLKSWEQLSEKANLAFFGLSEDATDRELDVAYRQMSKKMHPDKNGGTEESKERFQDMKKKYEALKKEARHAGQRRAGKGEWGGRRG